MRKSELFEAFDLFDVRDFGKVITFYFFKCIFKLENALSNTVVYLEVGHVTEVVWALCSYILHIDGLAEKKKKRTVELLLFFFFKFKAV